jgi:uncharacterized protein (TIGR00375 family)
LQIISDLHLHSKYSRATSKGLDIKNLEKWARIKGLNLLGTGDFTHPKWIEELKENLKEDDSGILKTKEGMSFILQSEVSLVYSDGGKGRRVHNVILAPNFDVVRQITEYLLKKGRVDYDGRPIFKIPCPEFTESLMQISKDIEIIPAHCLVGEETIHTNNTLKMIKDVIVGDRVYTHKNRWKNVTRTFNREYSGSIYHIRPWYFTEGIKVTGEHPFYGIKSYKCSWIRGLCKKYCSKIDECKSPRFNNYLVEWIPASELKEGDFILYPRFNNVAKTKTLDNISINKELCLLIGYYLAEGYLIRDEAIGFSFSKKEDKYIEEVAKLVLSTFGKKEFKIDERKGKDIIFYSKSLNRFFSKFYNLNRTKANSKCLPQFMLELPREHQSEILRGWYRGDKGYTVSRELMNQMKIISLRLGIIPNIRVDRASEHEKRGKHFIKGRKITANYDLYSFSNMSFFEDKFDLLKDDVFKKFNTKMSRRHGWIDEDFIYIPIRKIGKKRFSGKVYNLEVEDDNSYVSEFVTVHNCWTPWFALFGSMSGFDSVEEAFKDKSNHIHALETGLSSDPPMNWRLSKLDKYSLVSTSDSHSFWPWRIGREATTFELKELTYKNLINALRTKNGLTGTIEVDPAYGKYHWDGHRACNVCLSPSETRKMNGICPKCGKEVTIGVEYRVEQLADRPMGFRPKEAKDFKRLIPLSEILSKFLATPIASKKTWAEYNKLIAQFNNEFNILINVPESDLKKAVDEKIAQAIIKAREGKIEVQPGYDGEYGIPIFDESDKKEFPKFEKPKKVQKGLGDFI